MLDWARRRNHVLPVFVGLVGVFTSTMVFIMVGWVGGVLSFFVSLFFLYLEVVTQWSFRAPSKRKPSLEEDGWERLSINASGYDLMFYLHAGSPGAPLALVCHGWTSGAVRMVHRASSFLERGWNVVMLDLPSHGGSQSLPKWSAEQATTLLIQSLNVLQKQRTELFGNEVCYYGHSIGAFIGLRISKRREELNEPAHPTAWIFESPMTGYTEIHEETCNILKIPQLLRPWVLNKTLRHFNAINGPVRVVSTLTDADMPTWGITTEPTLMVQANPDERLGAVHHQRLIAVMSSEGDPSLLTTHLLNDLRHSGSHESSSRNSVIDPWIDETFTHSSSV